MSVLIQDLAQQTSAGYRRGADRLEQELNLRRAEAALTSSTTTTTTTIGPDYPPWMAETELNARRQKAVESARQAAGYAVSQLPQAEGVWQSVLGVLRKEPTGSDAESLLRTLLEGFESGLRLVRAAHALWEVAEQMGVTPERLDELGRAEERFQEMAAEAKRALDHRARGWQPADPDRLAEGLKLAREGKIVTADEARAWFRRG